MYEEVKTACIYARYSSSNQTEQSIEGQLRVCREFCNHHNIRIVEIYTDRATSASKDIEKRVSFLKMIKDSEKGNFDAVIVYKLDRFARSRYDSATYKYRLRKTEYSLYQPQRISAMTQKVSFLSPSLKVWLNFTVRNSPRKSIVVYGSQPISIIP